jgi:DNA-directed RNA polymerase subunit RPC12/RpoP
MSAGQPTHICPKCSSEEIVRVRRAVLRDYVNRLLGWRVYRCADCDTRFYDRPVGRRVA